VLTNLYHDRQLYNTLIPPWHESPALGLRISREWIRELTLRYTTPDIHCRHRRHECDGGITLDWIYMYGRLPRDVSIKHFLSASKLMHQANEKCQSQKEGSKYTCSPCKFSKVGGDASRGSHRVGGKSRDLGEVSMVK